MEEPGKLQVISPPEKRASVLTSYEPPEWGWRMVDAFLDPDVKDTTRARCEAAGISSPVWYKWINRPDFKEWLDGFVSGCANSWTVAATHRVRRALLDECKAGNLDAIQLWFTVIERQSPGPQHVHQHLTVEAMERLRRFQHVD